MRRTLLATLTLILASTAYGQNLRSTEGSAGNYYTNEVQGTARGFNYSIDAINNGILQQSRAYGANNGLGAVPTTNSSITPRIPAGGFGGGGALAQKPFSGVSNGSTVSPYLNLFNSGVGGGAQSIDNYNVLVRPQLEQQRTNQALQRQQQQLNLRVQAISAGADFKPGGSEQMIATGHQTGIRYYSHYFPTINNAQQRRKQQ